MKKTVLIGGGSGLIGQRLSELLSERGYEVRLLSRSKDRKSDFPVFQWDVKKGNIEEEAFDGLDYVINLAGAGIADQRWSESRKEAIISSRVESTALLWDYIRKKTPKLKAYVSASAIGFYGDAGEEIQTESSRPGDGFLSSSTKAWEMAAFSGLPGVRTAAIRIGIVASTKGGAFEKLIMPARFGLATYFGDGRQWYSWIHLDDLCRMFIFLLENEKAEGIYNGVSPQPSRLKPLVAAIRSALGTPGLLLPVPEFLMRIPMGEMADVLFSSSNVSAEKITSAGFQFEHPELKPALKDLISRGV